MKFSAPLALACFSAGVLANVTPRSAKDFHVAIATGQKDVDILTTAVNEFTVDISHVQDAATTLVDDINRSNIKLSVEATLTIAQTIELDSPIRTFIEHIKNLIASLKTRRSDVIAAGKCGLVRENIYAIDTAAGTFMETLVVKCDPNAQEIAEQREQLVQALLNGCKEDFSTSNCP